MPGCFPAFCLRTYSGSGFVDEQPVSRHLRKGGFGRKQTLFFCAARGKS